MNIERSEASEQIAFMIRSKLILSEKHFRLMWGSAAGVRTNIRQAALAKKMGNKKGIPDVSFRVARGGFHGLDIEMKRLYPKKGSVKPEQRQMIADLNSEGYSAHIAYGADEAFDILQAYLKLDS